jgi:hypothetical protein
MDRIDELLLDWYTHSQSYTPALGYGRADPACREFRTSRQWMDFDDLDAEVERNRQAGVAKTVEPMVMKLDLRGRMAVNTMCRNFAAGSQVWSTVRVENLEQEYERAKAILCPMMVAEGLIDKTACKPVNFGVTSGSVGAALAL